MLTVYSYAILCHKLYACLLHLSRRLEQRFNSPIVQVESREEFVALLNEDRCARAQIVLARFNLRDSGKPDKLLYVEARAVTKKYGEVIYTQEPGIELPINSPFLTRQPAECQAKILRNFLAQNGISVWVNNEFGCALQIFED